MSIPAIFSFALMEVQDQINFLFVGSLADTNELAAVGLG